MKFMANIVGNVTLVKTLAHDLSLPSIRRTKQDVLAEAYIPSLSPIKLSGWLKSATMLAVELSETDEAFELGIGS